MKKLLLILSMFAALACSKDMVKSLRITSSAYGDGPYSLYIGQAIMLEVETTPAGASPELTWSTDSPEILDVGDGGLIIAKSEGAARVRVQTAKGKSAETDVYVRAYEVTSWKMPSSIEVAPGSSVEFTMTNFVPAEANAGSLFITQGGDASDEKLKNIYTISQNENVFTISIPDDLSLNGYHGIMRVGNKTGDVIKELDIKYVYRPITAINFSLQKSTLEVGQTTTYTLGFTPTNATDTNIEFSQSDASVAVLDRANKTVTALRPGSCTITATASNGVKANVTVTVKGAQIQGLKTLFVGDSRTYTLSGNASGVKWSISDGSYYASVDENGKVTALAAGMATIKAEYSGGEAYLPIITTKKDYQIRFYHSYNEPDSKYGYCEGQYPAETDLFVAPGLSKTIYMGMPTGYVFASMWQSENPAEGLYGSKYYEAFKVSSQSGNLSALVEGGTVYMSAKNNQVGDTCNATIVDSGSARGTVKATVGFKNLTVTNYKFSSNTETMTTLNLSGTYTVSRPSSSSDYQHITVAGNLFSSYDRYMSYQFSIWSDYYTVVNDENAITVNSSSNSIRVTSTTKAGTYNFHLKEYPQIKWTIKIL